MCAVAAATRFDGKLSASRPLAAKSHSISDRDDAQADSLVSHDVRVEIPERLRVLVLNLCMHNSSTSHQPNKQGSMMMMMP